MPKEEAKNTATLYVRIIVKDWRHFFAIAWPERNCRFRPLTRSFRDPVPLIGLKIPAGLAVAHSHTDLGYP